MLSFNNDDNHHPDSPIPSMNKRNLFPSLSPYPKAPTSPFPKKALPSPTTNMLRDFILTPARKVKLAVMSSVIRMRKREKEMRNEKGGVNLTEPISTQISFSRTVTTTGAAASNIAAAITNSIATITTALTPRKTASTVPPSNVITIHSPDVAPPSLYPLLEKYGGAMERDEEMKILIGEIVRFHRDQQKQIIFTHRNGSKGLLMAVSVMTSKNYFGRKKNREWLATMFEFMAGGKDEYLSSIIQWLCKWLTDTHRDVFEEVGRKIGLVKMKKMTAEEAGAMWADANVPIRTAKIIMRHMTNYYGISLQAPMQHIASLGRKSSCVPIKFGEYDYTAEEGKRSTKIEYWTRHLGEYICADMARLIMHKDRVLEGGDSELTYGDIVLVAGSDHGKGASRFVAKLNLLPSSVRRESQDLSKGTRQFDFGKIVCKKESEELLNLVMPDVCAMLKELDEEKLVAVKDSIGHVCTVLIPKDATDLTTATNQHEVVLQYRTNNNQQFKILKSIEHQNINTHYAIWTVISSFSIYFAGDLSFYAMAMGRSGTSGTRCPYCTSNSSQWDESRNAEPPVEADELTMSLLLEYAAEAATAPNATNRNATKGVKCVPMLHIEPNRYCIPILHMEMGLFNAIWKKLLHFIDDNVEKLSIEEIEKRRGLRESMARVKEWQIEFDEYEIKKRDLFTRRVSLNKDKAKKKRLLSTEKKKLSKADSEQQWLLLTSSVKSAQDAFDAVATRHAMTSREHDEIHRSMKGLEGKLKEERKTVVSLKTVCVEMKTKRKLDKNGMDSLVEKACGEIANAHPESYHGGAFNGVSCRRILDNAKEVMDKLGEIAESRRKESVRAIMMRVEGGDSNDTMIMICKEEELTEKISMYTDLLLLMDHAFALIRVVAPLKGEIAQAERAISAFKIQWYKLKLPITPKAHILFKHTVAFMRNTPGGIADKCEDFVEKAHQGGYRLDQLTKTMSGSFKDQQRTQLSRQWLASEPAVQLQTLKVNKESRRKQSKATIAKRLHRVKPKKERRYITRTEVVPRITSEK
jgi:hypothetical protein